MDVVGNNLANVNTTGYKGSRTTFTDTLSQTVQGAQAGSDSAGGQNPMQVGLGMTVAAIDRNMGQGALQSTGRNLDMAIEGEGWFVVGGTNPLTSEDSYYYTRAGNFFIDDSYNLVTPGGDFVFGWNDSDDSGTIDPASDEMAFIKLAPDGENSITNALASATPPLSGPNLGDAVIKEVDVTPNTLSDKWRVECVNAEKGWFSVSGTRAGAIGTFPYDAPISDPSMFGTFTVDMGPPAQARMTASFVDGDGSSEILHFDNQSGIDYVIDFASGATGGVQVSADLVNNRISVTADADIDGNVVRARSLISTWAM
jgi:flagellar hook protein FlgE